LGRIAELEAKGIHNTGSMNLGGSIATAGGLVFIAATNDALFRAFESRTGKLLWEHSIDGNGHTIPITYLGSNGKQYVVVMAGGGGGYFGGTPSDSVMAFALGEPGAAPELTTALPRSSVVAAKETPRMARDRLPDGENSDLVQRTCGTQCHDVATITSRRMTRVQWSAVIDNMVARGAKATPAQVAVILQYLTRHFGN
jgi:quinoprotein glucose dehydrogenase